MAANGKDYHKVTKFPDARKLCCNLPKIQTKSPNFRVFRQKDANGIANSEDPDQTAPAPLGAVRSGSALFARIYLSKNLGSLRYTGNVVAFVIIAFLFAYNLKTAAFLRKGSLH